MRLILRAISVLVLSVGAVFSAQASDFATPAEAKTMALKAAAHVAEAGLDTAIKDFMTAGGDWHDRDLYVFLQDKDGNVLAHGVKAALVGKNMTPLKDPTGFAFVKDGINKVEGEGWVDYMWQHPATKKVTQKTTYIVVLRDGSRLGVGAYK